MVASGGMGTVWQATDELLDRTVALKQVRLDGLDPVGAETARQRVLREARVAARLHHPNAVTIFDVIIEGADPWLVLEYVPSQSLGDRMRGAGALDVEETVRIGCAVAEALAAAHGRGIVHRDVKPTNILLGESGAVKLTDFGISRAVGDLSLTASGTLIGTPAYLAPEVAAGLDATPASDVFALGATLYEAVEGAPPFGTGDDGNVLALLRRVTEGWVAPPLRAGALTGPLMRMLDTDPVRRPTATEVETMLRSTATSETATNERATSETVTSETAANKTATNETAAGETATSVTATDETVRLPTGAIRVPWYRRAAVVTGGAIVLAAGLVAIAAALGRPAPDGGSPQVRASAAVAWPAPLRPCDQSHGELVVGMIGPLTGEVAAMGLGMRNSAQLAVDQANVACTVPGYRLVLRPLDDVATAQNAEEAAQSLRSEPALVGVIGPLGTTTTEAVQRVLHTVGVVEISGTSTWDALTRGESTAPLRPYPEYFRLNPREALQGYGAAQHALGVMGNRTAVVVTDTRGWSNAIAEMFVRRAQDYHQSGVLLRETIANEVQNYPATAARIAALRPDVVYFAGEDAVAARLAVQLTAAGVTAPLVGSDDLTTDRFYEGARDGDIVTLPGADDVMLPGAERYTAAYRAAGFVEPPGRYGAVTYDATQVLVNALASLTAHGPWGFERRAELVQAVQKTEMSGVTGRIAFDEFGDAKHPVFTVFEIRGKEPVPLSVVRPFG